MLPKWVEVSEQRFNKILSTVTKARNKGLKNRVDGREITLDKTKNFLKHLRSGILDLKKY